MNSKALTVVVGKSFPRTGSGPFVLRVLVFLLLGLVDDCSGEVIQRPLVVLEVLHVEEAALEVGVGAVFSLVRGLGDHLVHGGKSSVQLSLPALLLPWDSSPISAFQFALPLHEVFKRPARACELSSRLQ